MIINVLQEDIYNGICHSSRACPIAIAIKRTIGVDRVCVSNNIWIKRTKIRTPESAMTFIEKYDSNKPVEPFSFDLPLLQVGI